MTETETGSDLRCGGEREPIDDPEVAAVTTPPASRSSRRHSAAGRAPTATTGPGPMATLGADGQAHSLLDAGRIPLEGGAWGRSLPVAAGEWVAWPRLAAAR